MGDLSAEREGGGLSPTGKLRKQLWHGVVNTGHGIRTGVTPVGIRFHVKGLLDFDAEVPMPGRFSVYNALCAIAICRHFNADTEAIRKALLGIKVRGRIEMVKVSDRFTLLIDYAHNALSLRSLLNSLRDYEPHRLVTLFGCGGDRDPERRFLMGEESGRTSDFTIITSDNPRTEDPMKIIEDIETGMKRTDGAYITIPDRKEAIAYAIHHGQEGDIPAGPPPR